MTADLPSGTPAPDPGTTADEKEEDVEQEAMGQQLLLVVGTALFLVLALFFVTQWSGQYEWGSNETNTAASEQTASSGTSRASSSGGGSSQATTSAQGASLQALVSEVGGTPSGSVARRIDSLRTRVEGADEESQRRQLQAELVNLYIGAGTPGQAALVQNQIADATGAVADRRRASDLLYRWMRTLQQEGNRSKVVEVARHVAEGYEAVVDQRPQDLDARTRMGEAYLLTSNPMKGIQAINAVLDDDSTFVPARFQKGLALLQINRLDQAVRQFEKVKEHAGEGEPFYRQAERAIQVIKEQTSTSTQTPSSTARP